MVLTPFRRTENSQHNVVDLSPSINPGAPLDGAAPPVSIFGGLDPFNALSLSNLAHLAPAEANPERNARPETLNALNVGAPMDPPTQHELARAKKALEHLGYNPGRMNTPRARADVATFQRAVGLTNEAPGEVTPRTLKRLERTAKRLKNNGKGFLTPGMKGARVKKLQQRLARLGDFQGTPSGVYDKATGDAVLSFRKRHPNLPQDARSFGKRGQKALRTELDNMAHDPYRTRVKPSAERRALDRKAKHEAATNGIGPGSPPEVIAYFQKHLKRAGYDPNTYKGHWNAHTAAMAKQFERRAGIQNSSDRFGPETWSKLSESTIETRSAFSPTQKIGERGHAVLVEERLLKKAGMNPGKVDGIYTRATERAADRLRAHFGIHHRNGIGVGTDKLIHRRIKQLNSLHKPVDFRLTPGSEFLIPDAEGAPSSHGGNFHAAKDWFAPGGTRVSSPINGTVVEVRPSLNNSGQVFGGTVKVQGKNGRVWVFRHVNPADVHVGQKVKGGQTIARVTNWLDGPDHTHIELWKTLSGGYRLENMIDPMRYLKRFL